jgi:hypothetical protein
MRYCKAPEQTGQFASVVNLLNASGTMRCGVIDKKMMQINQSTSKKLINPAWLGMIRGRKFQFFQKISVI